MSNIPNREQAIARMDVQISVKILWAQWWLAYASTGAAARQEISRGREPTEEERAGGTTMGWRPLTDQEKIDDAFNTAKQHIHQLSNCGEIKAALLADDYEAYQEACCRN